MSALLKDIRELTFHHDELAHEELDREGLERDKP